MRFNNTYLLIISFLILFVNCSKRHEIRKSYVGNYQVELRTGGYGLPDGTWVPLEIIYANGSVSRKLFNKLDFYCEDTDEHFVISLDKEGEFVHQKGDYEGIFYNLRDHRDTVVILTKHYELSYYLGGPNMRFIKQ